MMTRVLSITATAAIVSLATSAAIAESLTDRLQAARMTVVRVDKGAGKFLCAEHRRWTAVSAADLSAVHPGDIVKVDRRAAAAEDHGGAQRVRRDRQPRAVDRPPARGQRAGP